MASRRLLPDRDSATASVVATNARLSCFARRKGPRGPPRWRRAGARAAVSEAESVSVADVSEPASETSEAVESQRAAGGLGAQLAPNASKSVWNCARRQRPQQRCLLSVCRPCVRRAKTHCQRSETNRTTQLSGNIARAQCRAGMQFPCAPCNI